MLKNAIKIRQISKCQISHMRVALTSGVKTERMMTPSFLIIFGTHFADFVIRK